jgi:hypothetical protein
LRAIAKVIGYLDVNGWRRSGELVANELLKIYNEEGIISHDTKEELIDFCEKQDGVRGLLVFDRIIEIKYPSPRNWIKRGDVSELFEGKLP